MSFIPKAETFQVVAAPLRWHRSRLAETDTSDQASASAGSAKARSAVPAKKVTESSDVPLSAAQ
jgi:hypothetical protein